MITEQIEQIESPAPVEEAVEAPPTPRRRRRLLPALLVVCALGLVSGLLIRRLEPRPVPPPVVPVYTPQQAAQAQSHLEALRTQLIHPDGAPPEAAATPTQAVTRRPSKAASQRVRRLQLSQQDLNAYLATNPNAKAFLARQGVKAVQITFIAPRNLRIRAAVLYRGRPANVQIMGRIEPDRRTILGFTATSAQVGRLPLPPEAVNAQANRLARQFTRRLQGRLPLSVRTLEVVGDHLVLTGVPVAKR